MFTLNGLCPLIPSETLWDEVWRNTSDALLLKWTMGVYHRYSDYVCVLSVTLSLNLSLCHLCFVIFQTQREYKDKLDVFVDHQRVEDMKRSVQALGVKFFFKNTKVFTETWLMQLFRCQVKLL